MYALHKDVENQHIVQAEFTVSKRIMKKAVHRNRAKRQMRAVYRAIEKNLTFADSTHLIFFYTEKKELPFEQIKDAMLRAIQAFRTNDLQ
jgi:ribonuclease P protein component